MLNHAGLDAVRAALAQAPAWVWVVPPLLLLVNVGVSAARLRLLLDAPIHRILQAILLGNFFGTVLPTGGGEAIRLYVLGRHSGLAAAGAAMLLSRLLELLPWAALLVWGLLTLLPTRAPLLVWAAAGGAVAFLAAWLIGLIALRSPHYLPRPLAARLQGLPRPRRAALLLCQLLAFAFALVNCLTVWTITRAFGLPLSYLDVTALLPAADVLIALPITIAGVGVREQVFHYALSGWDIAGDVAVGVALTRWWAELVRAGCGGVIFLLNDTGSSHRVDRSSP